MLDSRCQRRYHQHKFTRFCIFSSRDVANRTPIQFYSICACRRKWIDCCRGTCALIHTYWGTTMFATVHHTPPPPLFPCTIPYLGTAQGTARADFNSRRSKRVRPDISSPSGGITGASPPALGQAGLESGAMTDATPPPPVLDYRMASGRESSSAPHPDAGGQQQQEEEMGTESSHVRRKVDHTSRRSRGKRKETR